VAVKQVRVSDLSGQQAAEEQFAKLKRFARSGDMVGHQRDRPQWRRNEYGNQWVARMRWTPRSAAAMTSLRVSPARLASSTPLRLAVKMPSGLFGEDGPGLRRWV
jgi:hypothetical protein